MNVVEDAHNKRLLNQNQNLKSFNSPLSDALLMHLHISIYCLSVCLSVSCNGRKGELPRLFCCFLIGTLGTFSFAKFLSLSLSLLVSRFLDMELTANSFQLCNCRICCLHLRLSPHHHYHHHHRHYDHHHHHHFSSFCLSYDDPIV